MRKSPIEYEITVAAVSADGDGRALINCQTADQQPVILHLGRAMLEILCAEATVVTKAERRKFAVPPQVAGYKKDRPE